MERDVGGGGEMGGGEMGGGEMSPGGGGMESGEMAGSNTDWWLWVMLTFFCFACIVVFIIIIFEDPEVRAVSRQ